MKRSNFVLILIIIGIIAGLTVTFAPHILDRTETESYGGPFTLVNQDDVTVTDKSFRGKWMMIYFGYTHCSDACPTTLSEMASALDKVGKDISQKITPVFVTVDPERDTVAVLKDYVTAFDAGIVGLTGSANNIAAAAKEYKVYYKKHPTADGYDMDHSSVIYLMDPEGNFKAALTGEIMADTIAEKIKEIVK